MPLIEDILAYDSARAVGRDAAVPATGGRTVVCLACCELLYGEPTIEDRLGIGDDYVVVIAVPAARVARADGDVARGVALVAGSAAAGDGTTDVIVLSHVGCEFRSPGFSVPGPAPQGESQSTDRDVVRASVAQLRASPWLARATVHGLLITAGGRLERVAESVGAAAPSVSGYSPGPVSLFGSGGGSLAAPPAPIAPTEMKWEAPPPIVMPVAEPMAFAPAPDWSPSAMPAPPSPSLMPTVGAFPDVGKVEPLETPQAPAMDVSQPRSTTGAVDAARPNWAANPNTPRPPAQRTPPPPPAPRPPPIPVARPPAAPADDPFARAEQILEKLRRQRRQ